MERVMVEPKVLYGVTAAGVARVTLNDPTRRNALSAEVLDALGGELERARDDPAVRCVVLASGHPTVFSAGADLQNCVGDRPLAERHDGAGGFVRVFELIGTLGKPTICAVDGAALVASAEGYTPRAIQLSEAARERLLLDRLHGVAKPLLIRVPAVRILLRQDVATAQAAGYVLPPPEAAYEGLAARLFVHPAGRRHLAGQHGHSPVLRGAGAAAGGRRGRRFGRVVDVGRRVVQRVRLRQQIVHAVLRSVRSCIPTNRKPRRSLAFVRRRRTSSLQSLSVTARRQNSARSPWH